MDRYNILVTGVGAIIGYGIVRCLRSSRYANRIRLIGMDIYGDAVGQEWCDAFEQSVLTAEPGYPEFLATVIKRHKIDLVIPGIEQDSQRINKSRAAFAALPTKLAINKPNVIEIFSDKWQSHLFLEERGIPAIATAIDGCFEEISAQFGIPFLLKPRRSYASKGICKIENEADLAYWRTKLGDNFMVQEIVGKAEPEYTVAVFGVGDGTYCGSIILERKLATDGSTAKARLSGENPSLRAFIDCIVGETKPLGPTNLQIIRDRGRYLLLEMNPRISSSTSIRQAFGYNEAEMCIQYFIENTVPKPAALRPGNAVRYIEDIVHFDSDTL